MPEWIPSESSSKGRLVLRALDAFSTDAFDDVNVVALCAEADVTTGTLYHHFGTKLGLYEVVRLEVERRTADRIAGALAARADDPPTVAVRAALLVAFDYVVDAGRVRLMGAPVPPGRDDALESAVRSVLDPQPAVAKVWLAAWRAALMCTLDGFSADDARSALARLRLDDDS
ncbi:MAG TPA: TetR/AcrR family transcriptional regulator [Mycobacterium sp.]|nr:TetR/AcrR family transcriptional regulator [Mycobacterium sp.]